MARAMSASWERNPNAIRVLTHTLNTNPRAMGERIGGTEGRGGVEISSVGDDLLQIHSPRPRPGGDSRSIDGPSTL